MKRPGCRWIAFQLLALMGHLEMGALAAEPLLKLELEPGISLELLLVQSGTFTMGSPAEEPGRSSDEVSHSVTLTQPYYLGKTEVTVGQFEAFVRATRYRTEAEDGKSGGYAWNGTKLEQSPRFTWKNPGYEQTPSHPVTLVTWADAKKFCQWLTVKSGKVVQLPTEAQWEFACRAGGTGTWSGSSPETVGWFLTNSSYRAHPVAEKSPNAWGFFDMHGNVWEWCEDWYGAYPTGNVQDPLQSSPPPNDKPRRVIRGGSWLKESKWMRSASRYRNDARSRNPDNGFRILVAATEVSASISVPGPANEDRAAGDGRIRIRPEVELGKPVEAPPKLIEPPVEHPAPTRIQPQNRSSWGRLAIVAIVFAVLAAIFVMLLRGLRNLLKGTGTGKVPVAEATPGATAARTQMFQVRSMQDGFWIQAAVAQGTRLGWRCLVGGKWHEGELEYLAGAQGQFVYTALPPSDIAVRTLGMSGIARPPGMGSTTSSSSDSDWGRAAGMWEVFNSTREQSRMPRTSNQPRNPSAY